MTRLISVIKIPASTLCAWMFFFAPNAQAERIDWGSTTNLPNLDSSGAPMDAVFQFQLGVFEGGFVPTMANLALWEEYWVAADTIAYDSSGSRFNSFHSVQDNEPPFVIGTPAWMFGQKTTSTGTEVILFRRPSWTWPAENPFGPGDLLWRVDGDANIEVVIGTVNPSASPFLMQSEVVRGYAQWREFTMPGETLNGPNDDPDGDGVANFFEFVFGTDPLDPAIRATADGGLVDVLGEQYLQLSIPRKRTHLANLVVQVSTDLVQWDAGPDFTEVVEDSAQLWIVRDRTPVAEAGPRRFMRLSASE